MKKKLACVLIFAVVLSLSALTVIAEPMQYSERPTIGYEATNPYFDSGSQTKSKLIDKSSGQVTDGYTPSAVADSGHAEISMWEFMFKKYGNGIFGAFADTMGDDIADEITNIVYFERWNGYYFEIYSYNSETAYDTYRLQSNFMFYGPKGYYYRISVDHQLHDNGYSESQYSISGFYYSD